MLDDTKKEMDHLRKQIRSLGTALVLTQVTTYYGRCSSIDSGRNCKHSQ